MLVHGSIATTFFSQPNSPYLCVHPQCESFGSDENGDEEFFLSVQLSLSYSGAERTFWMLYAALFFCCLRKACRCGVRVALCSTDCCVKLAAQPVGVPLLLLVALYTNRDQIQKVMKERQELEKVSYCPLLICLETQI